LVVGPETTLDHTAEIQIIDWRPDGIDIGVELPVAAESST